MNRPSQQARAEERRAEPREDCDEEVGLVLEPGVVVAGRALDRSTQGRRVAHHSLLVRTGMELVIRERKSELKARVIWTRISDKGIESGLLLTDRPNT